MTAQTITREDLAALAAREGIRLDKANDVLELCMLVGNALFRLPANQRGYAKTLILAALLDRTPERIEAVMATVFPQEARHV